MEIVEFIGYLGALFIGIVLGLIGGGGSILTVPVFVYLMNINPITATAYSLFVVGISSLIGSFSNVKKGLIDIRTALVFSVPAFIAVYITRRYLVPLIPDQIFDLNNFTFTKEIGIMIFFAIVMVLASISMIKNNKSDRDVETKIKYNYPFILIEGLVIGILTGIVGAGGGFLIIPALVLLAKLPMKKAVATSLLIIAIKSLIGFTGDLQNLEIDWLFLIGFTSISSLGIVLGMYISNFIEGKKLEKFFGWFVLIMSIYILFKELI